ncbi:hypothetical protein VTJ49DRAFT_3 [Mycothermus thermophilus]|uniref:DUF726-domain-containing protein n=1 Tax=Humicola insolens TaxID=85995 RepID=A0ABR3VRG2_HUMIN
MAPLATEPRQVLAVLNPARRKALYTLLVDITSRMRSRLEFHDPEITSAAKPSLLIDPSAENSIIVNEPDILIQPGSAIVKLRAAALAHFDDWRKDVLAKLKDLLATLDNLTIVDQRRKRAARVAQHQRHDNDSDDTRKAVARLQSYWPPIPTRLATITEYDRREALSCILLVLLSTGHYSAHSRAMAVYLTSSLGLPLDVLNTEEAEIAVLLVERSSEAGNQRTTMSAEAEAEKRRQENQANRLFKVGLASVAGAALIGVTGGLAAPVVAGAIGGLMGSVGLGGVASFLGIFWMNGALVGTLFGALGAKMTGEAIDQYAREVEDFRFISLKDEWGTRPPGAKDRRLRITIGINGWLDTKDDVTKPWRSLADDSEVFALRYEMDSLLGLGKSLRELVSSYAWNTVKVEILKRTVLATLWSALWPAYLLSMASVVDNPFSLAKNRSEKAGEILADALINKVQGERPVTLIGYSLGARVIHSCLRSLAERRAFGLVDNVVFVGAPVPSNRQHWQTMRAVVSGNLYNVYSENDYLLAFLYRATSVQLGVAGLQEICDVDGVYNLDLSDKIQSHMRYAKVLPQILAQCGIPVVRDADGPIQPGGDDNVDILRPAGLDKDNANLIDLANLNVSGPVGTSPTHSQSQPAKAPRVQTSVQQRPGTTLPAQPPTAPGVRSHQEDLLGLDFSMSSLSVSNPTPPSLQQPSSSQPRLQPQSTILNQPPEISPAETLSTKPILSVPPSSRDESKPSATRSPSLPASPPQQRAPSHVLTQQQISHRPSEFDDVWDRYDSDDDVGIQMVDNEDGGDLAYCDPTPIEEDDHHGGGHRHGHGWR